MTPLRLAIIGCGNIAPAYTAAIKTHPELAIVGFFDLDRTRAQALADVHGGRVFATLDEALADPEVEVIVNLTIFNAHFDVSRRALEAGKHVYSEKPLTLAAADARMLVDLAAARGLRLAGAPITFLGAAAQTAGRLIRAGELGEVRVIYAEVNHGRIETWHPNPAPFYAVGPMLDVGVYPLTLTTSILGPAARVTALGKTLLPERRTKDGQPFTITAPDFYLAAIELACGAVMRLSVNFYVDGHSHGAESIEFIGDAAKLWLSGWFAPEAEVKLAPFEGDYERVVVADVPAPGPFDWAMGLVDLALSMRTGSPQRVTGEQAAHIVEILEAVNRSAAEGRPIEIASRFTPPPPRG
ncbi:MAG: Gfo/Idh/MocA family oxidoreductase [Anaerolineales bacterium]|nr:Gfo/Idh/MocA family oxidoreductase [Anaerolineales bacterium]